MSRARPRIGLSMDTGPADENRRLYELSADYADAILRAGGLPVLLPHSHDASLRQEILATLDGLIIPGGADLDASLWGEAQHPKSYRMDPLRQENDLALLALAQARDLPTLGICLGCQMMNVARGGSLYQSIAETFPESPITHTRVKDPEHYNSSFHEVMVRPGTLLARILGVTELQTNSRHRQAVNALGRGLIASAFASDGILEAIEDYTKTFWLGVQWHPENLAGTLHEKLFAALVDAARTKREAAPRSTAASAP